MEERGSFIGGRWSNDGVPIEIKNPFDGTVAGICRQGGPAEIERAVATAVSAAAKLSELPLYARATILERAAALLRERRESFARRIQAEAGKPIRYARIEADRAVDTFTESAVAARRLEGEPVALDAYAPGAGRLGVVRRVPVGPIAAVSPFNFPLNLVAHKVGPAIAAGCPIVLKPASKTPLSALALCEVIAEAGLPDGGLNVVVAPRAAADALVGDERLKLLTFTGSAEVGWNLKARAGKKKVVLELGGNAAAIVEPDADVERAAARLAIGAFYYAGQSCISVQRIFVHESIADRFVAALVAAVEREVAVGDPGRDETVSGPLIDGQNADRIEAWTDEAVGAGARRILPARREGNVVWPTVLAGADPRLRIACEEAFGPVVLVDAYRDFGEAIERVNASKFGLQAAVFTADAGTILRAFDRLHVGAVIHDDSPAYRVDHMPYGGVKESGLGREGPRYAVLEMTEPRLLVLGEATRSTAAAPTRKSSHA